jgi:hypothetical protein
VFLLGINDGEQLFGTNLVINTSEPTSALLDRITRITPIRCA